MQTFNEVVKDVVIPVAKKHVKAVAEGANITITDNPIVESTEVENLNRIVLPTGMNKLEAAWNLVKEFENEETIQTLNRSFPLRFMNDFLGVINNLIVEEFGELIVSTHDTSGNHVDNDRYSMPVRYGENGLAVTQDIFMGSVTIPAWSEATMDINWKGGLTVRAKVKYANRVNAFFNKVEHKLNQQSAIQGAAVEIQTVAPGVMKTVPVKVKINEGIFLRDTTQRIVDNLIIPSLNEGKKKAILLTGDFGTGKTETAIKIGVEGMRRFNRTFFYLKNAAQFQQLMPYLKHYQRSTVFVEDIDQVMSGDRDSELNNLLNTIDGAELKNTDVVFVFTTNAHDKINPAMRRPGRIDEMIHFDYCDDTMVGKIYQHHLGILEGAETVDWNDAVSYTPKNLQGAVVAEIAGRAKKYAKQLHNGVLSTDVLKDSIASMAQQIEFMRRPEDKDNTLETAVRTLFMHGLPPGF